jgi:Flp pilus assembly protein TadG
MTANTSSDTQSCRSRPRRSQRGSVTAETAMVLPALLGVGFTLAFLVVAIGARIRCGDAAWEAARGLARGEPSEFAGQAVRTFAPAGALVTVRQADGYMIVRVADRVAFGKSSLLPGLTVADEARVPCEVGVACGATAAPTASQQETEAEPGPGPEPEPRSERGVPPW